MSTQRTRNRITVLALLGALGCMVALVAAAVPLYRLFCQVTGYGGTTQVADVAPENVLDRVVTIRFNSDVSPDLPWRFKPVDRKTEVKVGESKLAFFHAVNLSDETVTGTATYNVTPFKAAPYFVKVECFCFTEQVLAAGAEADMPVSFFIDPTIADDPNLDDVKTITLSYTFFPNVEVADNRAAREAN